MPRNETDSTPESDKPAASTYNLASAIADAIRSDPTLLGDFQHVENIDTHEYVHLAESGKSASFVIVLSGHGLNADTDRPYDLRRVFTVRVSRDS